MCRVSAKDKIHHYGSKEATQKKVCLLKGANTLYKGYPMEFAPEASKITGLEENSKNLNLKKRSLGKKKSYAD
jgi:hypothetical protein